MNKRLRDTLCSQVRVNRVEQSAYTIAPIVPWPAPWVIDGKPNLDGDSRGQVIEIWDKLFISDYISVMSHTGLCVYLYQNIIAFDLEVQNDHQPNNFHSSEREHRNCLHPLHQPFLFRLTPRLSSLSNMSAL